MLISFVREISFLGTSALYEAKVFLVAPSESVELQGLSWTNTVQAKQGAF